MTRKFMSMAKDTADGGMESCGHRKRLMRCSAVRDVLYIPLDRISPDSDQPRKEFDEEELFGLAGSMKVKGQLQPVRVRYDEDADHYILVAGERRWRAAKIAEIEKLAAIVDNEDKDVTLTQVVENLQRADLPPLALARAFRRLLDANNWSQSELGRRLGVSHTTVSRSLALLDLPPDDQSRVESGELKGTQLRDSTRKKPSGPRKNTPGPIKFKVNGITIAVTSRKVLTREDALAAMAAITLQEAKKRKAA